jgi:hypothetical protein
VEHGYLVQPNDQCALLATKNGITLSDFYFLNPDIDANCTNLWANSSCCIEPVGDISTYPGYYGNSTTSSIVLQTATGVTWADLPIVTVPSYPTTTPTGYPLANGSIAGCFETFDNSYGALTCASTADMFGVNVIDWIRWNPSLLNGGNYSLFTCVLANEPQYCGSFYNQSMVPPPLPIAYVPVPSDATANATTECLEWYTTEDNDACGTICQDYNIPYWALQEWNPALGPSAPYGGKLVVLSTAPAPRTCTTARFNHHSEWRPPQAYANRNCGWVHRMVCITNQRRVWMDSRQLQHLAGAVLRMEPSRGRFVPVSGPRRCVLC